MTRKFWKRTEPLDHAELARLLPAPSDPRMTPDRQLLFEEHLLNEIRTPAPKATARPVRRALLITVPVTAAALAGVLALGALTPGTGPNGEPASVEAAVVPIEAGSTVQLVSTVQRIATAATKQPTPEPKPGQYIYVKSEVSYQSSSHNADTGEEKTWVQPLHPREIWKSPDGLKGWLDEPGYQDEGGVPLGQDAPGSKPVNGKDIPGKAPSHLSYDWLKAQPTNPDALLKSIYATAGNTRDRDQRAFQEIKSIVNEQLVPARTAAALYRAAAKIPGVVVVENSEDATGRAGLALARVDERYGERTELVFDRTTFAYLGSRGVQVTEYDGVKPGTVTERTAILERAVVDARKTRPTTHGTA
ncbi:CU044_5270 family protein [Streptomyces laurentii]|uniref:CU044_5270 family protein n=1 Tax=Streptomyces laurentii TaxID=39478 RepID=UPI0036C8BD2E